MGQEKVCGGAVRSIDARDENVKHCGWCPIFWHWQRMFLHSFFFVKKDVGVNWGISRILEVKGNSNICLRKS